MMSERRRRLITALLLALAAVLLYGTRLGEVPMYLGHDEVFFGMTAHSVSTTGRDAAGRFLPLYFQWPPEISTNVFYQPMEVYLTALLLKAVPLSEVVLRLPTVLVGLADVVLMYFVGIRLFKRESLAIAAAVLLLLTPAHFIHSRFAMDYLYPVPFVLAWLLGLLVFLENGKRWTLFAATFALGVGFFSYIAAIVMMPIYLATTCGVLAWQRRPLRDYAAALAGFALPLLPVIPWLLTHPDAVALTARRYELGGQAHADTLLSTRTALVRGIRESLRFYAITERVSLYWYSFNPSFLFLSGGPTLVSGVRRFGVFLLPLAVFIPVGINQLINGRRTAAGALVLIGFLTAPVAACLVNESNAIFRELEVLPFGVLIAVAGMEVMLATRRTFVKWTAVGLLALVPLQFAFFYREYFGPYAVESASWFDGNVRGGLEDVIARAQRDPRATIYVPKILPRADWYWRLYLAKHRAPELRDRTVYFDANGFEPATMAPGSLMLAQDSDTAATQLINSDQMTKLRLISQPNGAPFLWVLQRR